MVALTEKTLTSPENQIKYYSPEEYLKLEEKAETKNEYRNGEIIPMAGATINHNKIALNFCRQFPLTIEKQIYEIFMSDVKLFIPEENIYTYPDVMIVRDNPIYQNDSKTIITNPLIIIEVLSLSTQDYDRGQKFKYYRSLESLQEYILIDQYEYSIEQFAKNQQGKWVLTEYKKLEEKLLLESIAWEIPLTDIYQRVEFPSKPEKAKSDSEKS
ncbi:Uma2 family endonuclease [Geminocystis herdmanii]|uniref:Uma2 family endonuclease n=1 Tax=Geminocystis herdmanii TaxID=669359 RepID=UPI000347568E|nr:Uma2 family endonuclease [Geminocystis herdmanii]